MNEVAVVKAVEVKAAVERGVELVGGLKLQGGEQVVIKPNICNAKNPHGMVNTDFRVIESLVDLVHEAGAKIVIVESDNISGTADKRLIESGLMKKLDDWGVPFLNLSHDNYEEHKITGETIRIPETVLEADYFINVPKIKTCGHTLVTLSIKNLYGVFQRAKKNKLHKYLDEILPYLAKTIRQDLIVVDGLVCMEGNGPVIGTPRSLGIIVTGKNTVSVDAVCTALMGYNPLEVTHILKSMEMGLGEADINNISIVGDDWSSFVCEFDKPYTLSSALKSIKSIKDIYFGN